MSVTFTTALDESAPRVFALECADGTVREQRTGGYEQMAALYEAHQLTCEVEDCRDYGPSIDMVGDFGPEVNMSNLNARGVLEALGIVDVEMVGEEDGEAFLGRVLLALAVAPADEGVPAHELVAGVFVAVGEGGPTFVHCGRRAGYLQERLVQLEEVARWAISVGRPVTWA
jgi:hypothetical protein